MFAQRIFFGVFVAFLCGVVGAAFALDRYEDAYDWVAHTSDVRIAIGRGIDHANAVDCNHLRVDVVRIERLTIDNPVQQARLPGLRIAIDGQCPREAMPAVVERLSQLDTTERMLLESRRQHLARARRWTLLAFFGSLAGALLIALVSQLNQARLVRRLGASEQKFRLLAAHASDLLRIHTADGKVTWASPSSERLLGYTPDELIALPPIVQLGHPEDVPKMQAELTRIQKPHEGAGLLSYRMRHKDGEYRWFETYSEPVRDRHGKLVQFFTTARDVTERVVALKALEDAAVTDELTGLLNRRGFTMIAGQQHRNAMRQRVGLAVLFADLDGLKKINDGLGHEHGDRAICELADVLRKTFRGSDVVARLGGDEYAVLAYDVDAAKLEIVLQRVRAAVEAKNAGADRAFRLSVSLGHALLDPARPRTLDELIADADQRMYEHKQSRGVQRAV